MIGLNISPGGPYWPIHNIINACIAISVSRIAQLPKLGWIIGLLALLMAYDVFFVYDTQVLTDGGESIMESVAKSKLQTDISYSTGEYGINSTPILLNVEDSKDYFTSFDEAIKSIVNFVKWRPGLFEVAIDGRISDALGLGDVVFPAILGGWSYRFDKAQSTDVSISNNTYPLYSSCIGGYIIGCIACELFQTGSGQPALLFLVPSMLISLSIATIKSKINPKDIFDFNG